MGDGRWSIGMRRGTSEKSEITIESTKHVAQEAINTHGDQSLALYVCVCCVTCHILCIGCRTCPAAIDELRNVMNLCTILIGDDAALRCARIGTEYDTILIDDTADGGTGLLSDRSGVTGGG